LNGGFTKRGIAGLPDGLLCVGDDMRGAQMVTMNGVELFTLEFGDGQLAV